MLGLLSAGIGKLVHFRTGAKGGQAKGVVLLLPGLGDTVQKWGHVAKALSARGYNVDGCSPLSAPPTPRHPRPDAARTDARAMTQDRLPRVGQEPA